MFLKITGNFQFLPLKSFNFPTTTDIEVERKRYETQLESINNASLKI